LEAPLRVLQTRCERRARELARRRRARRVRLASDTPCTAEQFCHGVAFFRKRGGAFAPRWLSERGETAPDRRRVSMRRPRLRKAIRVPSSARIAACSAARPRTLRKAAAATTWG
jgi:hypothetical protein